MRVNQTLVAKLRCKVNLTTKTPWTKLLEQVTYGYNNSPHDVTGFPPACLMFGTLPYDSPLPNQVKLNYPPIQQARQIAVNRTIKHHKINKQRKEIVYCEKDFTLGMNKSQLHWAAVLNYYSSDANETNKAAPVPRSSEMTTS
ncbi:transposon Tf2-6 polyprotein [Trichonephila clavipes]|uniref:Transposon Tf2-6 polyprotein n=1 Tax=Trichonephila clavipes TaxID=2585209 RepID=A0A8X6W2A8_TRICX|nr:transposon Tf2-6 polyprotein [Trichonephila clavipes]